MSQAQMEQEIAKLKAENVRLAAAAAKKQARLSLKVSEKGGLSLYGMGRFPVTLYREQWERLLAHKGEIETFIAANAGTLKLKGVE